MFTVLTNCVFMSLKEPAAWSRVLDTLFTAVYTGEAVMKILSRGFCAGRFTFLRDPWNWLDVVVISTGFLTEFVDLGKVSVLKTVPRVLKIIPVIPGLKKTVAALVQSLKGLASALFLVLLCISSLALIGQLLFMGDLKNKCVIWPDMENMTGAPTGISFQESINNTAHQYFLPGRRDALLCGNNSNSGRCPEGYTCLKAGSNPDYGYSSFDSFGWSLLNLMNSWEDLLQRTLRAAGTAYLAVFVLVFFPGCFCVLGLAFGAVASLCREREEAGVAKLRRREDEFALILNAVKRREEEEVRLS
ncbi:Sodium channel protein type 4 subunit alpha A [Liparis tanakae]|uniref:Sodium channel protein type 4 subunit alpha A n=1 Tax=Liparis tanakae TaxID=230148 RepID=A0A4Z2F3Y0_9TELE|nr:Sodium channel protein type 4 subunit alpha A [Liparis tanakae]